MHRYVGGLLCHLEPPRPRARLADTIECLFEVAKLRGCSVGSRQADREVKTRQDRPGSARLGEQPL